MFWIYSTSCLNKIITLTPLTLHHHYAGLTCLAPYATYTREKKETSPIQHRRLAQLLHLFPFIPFGFIRYFAA